MVLKSFSSARWFGGSTFGNKFQLLSYIYIYIYISLSLSLSLLIENPFHNWFSIGIFWKVVLVWNWNLGFIWGNLAWICVFQTWNPFPITIFWRRNLCGKWKFAKILVMGVKDPCKCTNKVHEQKQLWQKLHNNKSKVKIYFLVKLKVMIGVGCFFFFFLRTRDSSSKESF